MSIIPCKEEKGSKREEMNSLISRIYCWVKTRDGGCSSKKEKKNKNKYFPLLNICPLIKFRVYSWNFQRCWFN